MNNLGDIILAHDLFVLFFEGHTNKIMVLVLYTPFVVYLLDYNYETKSKESYQDCSKKLVFITYFEL